MALVMTVVFALSSFSSGKSASSSSDESCTVYVKYGNGDPAANVGVLPQHYSGVLGWMAADSEKKTDSSGKVVFTWNSYSTTIHALYIKGNRYEMRLEDGREYTVILKQKHEYD